MKLQKAISVKTALTTLMLTFIVALTIVLLTIVFGGTDDVDILIENNVAGQLETNIYTKLSFQDKALEDITSIRVTGELSQEDLNWFTNSELTKLSIVDLSRAEAPGAYIGEYYMAGNHTINVFKLPRGIREIGGYAFAFCSNLVEIMLPDSVETMGNHAFEQCVSLTRVTILGFISYVGSEVFIECYNIKDLTVPYNLTSPFYDRTYDWSDVKLTMIYPDYTTIDDLFAIDEWELIAGFRSGNPFGTGYATNGVITRKVFPVSDIHIVAENNVAGNLQTRIEEEMLREGAIKSTILSITVTGELSQEDLWWIEENKYELEKLSVVDLSKAEAPDTYIPERYMQETNINIFRLPYGVRRISKFAFMSCANLREITIPDSVEEIKDWAFNSCYALEGDLVIPNSVAEISQGVFGGCHNLNSITITNANISVDNSAFSGCDGIKELTIPYNLEGDFYYYNSGELTDVKLTLIYPEDTTVDELLVITKSDMLQKFSSQDRFASGYVTNGERTRKVFPILDIHVVVENNAAGSLQSRIQEELLKEEATLGNILSITVTGNLSQEDLNWFKDNNSNLTKMYKINLEGASATGLEIPSEFMVSKTILTEFTYPTGIIKIGQLAFTETGLTGELIIPDSVINIGSDAFGYCSGLTGNLIIPDSVTNIGPYAFYDCSGLTGVIMPKDIDLSSSTFTNVGLIKLTLSYPSETKASQLYGATETEITSKMSASWGLTINEGYVTNNTITRKVFPITPHDIDIIIENNVAGGLSERIYEEVINQETLLDNVLSITVTGELSQEDLDWLRDNKDNLTKMYKIDLENANATGLGIPDEFMKDNTMLTTFSFPSGITSIGDNAFEDCSNLEGDLVIPNSVVSIGIQAFYNCSGFDRNISNTKFSS